MSKTCPVSNTDFTSKAQPLTITVGNTQLAANPRTFSTGSFGWNASGKTVVVVDGKPVACQVSLNVTAIGSREAK